jgi:drug/metabolite transporter (DMT)-like permease
MLLGGLRYVCAGAILAAVLGVTGQRLRPGRDWRVLALLGFLMLTFGNGGVVVAELWVPSGMTAVIVATAPFWMVGVERAFPGGERLAVQHWAGLALGFTGIVVLVWRDLQQGGAAGRSFALGVVALQLACAAWAVGSSYSKRRAHRLEPFAGAAWQMLFGGGWMVLIGTLLGEWRGFAPSGRSTLAVLYLVFVGSIAGYGAYLYALHYLRVSFVSLYAYVNPVIATLLGVWLLSEPFTVQTAIGAAIILAGMAVVTTARPA